MKKFPFLLTLLISVTLLSGCSGLSTQNTTKTYVLHVDTQALPSSDKKNKSKQVLQVAIPKAAAGFDSPALLYLKQDYELNEYSKSRWIDTPARMLLPLLVQSLEHSQQFAAVLSASNAQLGGELRLETEIIRLQQDFRHTPTQIELVVRVHVLDMVKHEILLAKTISITKIAPTADAQGGVMASNAAIEAFLTQLIKEIDTI